MRRFLLATCLMGLTVPAHAETPSPVKIAELSARLYAMGVEAGDPLLILSAARLRKALAPVAADRAAVDGVWERGRRCPGRRCWPRPPVWRGRMKR
jgi:hypothetical protein